MNLPDLALAALDSHSEPIFIIDQSRKVQYYNKPALELLLEDHGCVVSNDIDQAFSLLGPGAIAKIKSYMDMFFRGYHDEPTEKEFILEPDTHLDSVLELRISPIFLDKGRPQEKFQGALLLFRDVTPQWKLNNQLHYHATHDSLTGLINRREFENKLAEFIRHGNQTGVQHYFCFIDLNKFKQINDRYGHIAGDKLLKELGYHFTSQLRKGDVLGRIGGDEFGLILSGCAAQDAMRVLEKIKNSLANYKFSFNGDSIQISVSIGLIDFGQENKSVKEMMHRADFACYKAKKDECEESRIVYMPESPL